MKDTEKAAIQKFFEIVAKLKELEVIRSDKYLGDIGEFIAAHLCNIDLAESGREVGHDGIDACGNKVQIKFHGSTTRTNIDLGNPDKYRFMIVVLGPDSLLRSNEYQEDFLLYRLSSEKVKQYLNKNGNGRKSYSCGKSAFNTKPDKVLSLNVGCGSQPAA